MKHFYLPFILLCFWGTISAQNIKINEILASNSTINTDENGSHEDWVELYNSGSESLSLNGYGLTDDASAPFKWTFPNVTLGAGQYLLVWCSDKNRTNPGSPLHTNFKISASGETITLTQPNGTIADSAPAAAMPANVSYGRIPNGSGSFMFITAVTPGAANGSTGYTETLPEPIFSHQGGFYTSGFQLALTTSVSGASIIYTTDGSEPAMEHVGGTTYNYKNQYPETPGQPLGQMLTGEFETLQYNNPLNIVDRSPQPNKLANISTTYHFVAQYIPDSPIFKGTVVRARVVKPGALPGPVVTKTYFVTPEGLNRFSIPVLSFAINEDRLFDFNTGIYTAGIDFENWRAANPTTLPDYIEDNANFFRKGIENEVPASMEYFVGGNSVINQNVGVRINGGSSRAWQNKSLSIYARDDYGNDKMEYQFFPNQPADYERLGLHNSGSDFFETLFRDALCQELMKNLKVVTKGFQPTVVFINGEYWGILSLRDKIDNQYFERMFNVPDDEIDVIGSQNSIEEGDMVHYNAMMSYVESHNLSEESNYQYVTTQLDPDNFADYFISNIFMQNVDWPGNNILRWRKRTDNYVPDAPFGHDGRWRWYAHDMDATFAVHGPELDHDSLAAATATDGPSWPNPAWSTLLFRKMLENNHFKEYFITRFADLLNTTYLTDRIIETIDGMAALIEPEIAEQSQRWDAPSSADYWNYNLQIQRDFAEQRPAIQREHIRQKFNITSNLTAVLNVSDPSHGHIKINTIDIKDGTDGINANPYPWAGIYFSHIPIKLKAIAAPGFTFSHWSGASSQTIAEITITTANSFSVTAHFVPDDSPAAQPIYFWMMDNEIANDTPLEFLSSTFEAGSLDAMLDYESCLTGYPFTSSHPNWRKASMERRNSPTAINYIPEANDNLPFATSNMRGVQIREPLHSGGQQSAMVFSAPTTGFQDIKFSFAAMNEGSNSDALMIDYSVNSGSPQWIASGIVASHPMAAGYELHEVDFSSVAAAENNPDFKVRVRFSGTAMDVDNGNRVTFNNIAVFGTPATLAVDHNSASIFTAYPNPAAESIYVHGGVAEINYEIFSLDGKRIRTGAAENSRINLGGIASGVYMLKLESNGRTEVLKIAKK